MRIIITLFLAFFATSSAYCTVTIEDVTLGFNKGYKTGKWTPLNVTVRSQNEPSTFSGEVVVEVRNIISDQPIYRYATPLRLNKTDQKHKTLYIYCPKTVINVAIQIVGTKKSDEGIEASIAALLATHAIVPPTPIANKDYFVLVLAPSGDKLQNFIDNNPLDDENTQAHIKYLPNANALPIKWIGYDAVDIMVIREVSLSDRRISKSQQTALLAWVQRGGTLIVSGGSNFSYLKGSFIEQHLPVKLIREMTIDKMPLVLQQQFGSDVSPTDKGDLEGSPFKVIQFEPKPECHTLLGTDKQIYIAKRALGSGQIISLAFDYNAPSFSDKRVGETLWRWLLTKHGKSPKLLSERYSPFRQHEEKIQKQFLSKMPTQVPIIKLLSGILPLYILCLGGMTFYFGRRNHPLQKRFRSYWMSGLIFVLVSVSAIGVARTILPKKIITEHFSILSIFPEINNANIQSYVSLRVAARTNTHMPLTQDTVIRPLEYRNISNPSQFFQGIPFQQRDVIIEPWNPSNYLKETFFPLDIQKTDITLENTWRITNEASTYLGTVTLGKNKLSSSESSNETIRKIPSLKGLDGTRKEFAKILQQEGLLQYLLHEKSELIIDNTPQRKVLIGWTSQLEQILAGNPKISTSENFSSNGETLVIMYLDETDL